MRLERPRAHSRYRCHRIPRSVSSGASEARCDSEIAPAIWVVAERLSCKGVNLNQGLYVAMVASLWPDQIRNHDDPSTFPNWHLVDYPLIAPSFPFRGSPVPRDDILFGICKSESILRSRSASAPDKAEKMSWLIHLVGDVHQPLHCATLINSFYPAPQGDRGGNEFFVKVSSSGKPRKLHSLRDGLLGSGTAADTRLTRSALNNAIRLQTVYRRATLPELQSHHSVKSWTKESRKTAIHDAYWTGRCPWGAIMRRSCPLGILSMQKRSPSGALHWRVTVWRTKFGV